MMRTRCQCQPCIFAVWNDKRLKAVSFEEATMAAEMGFSHWQKDGVCYVVAAHLLAVQAAVALEGPPTLLEQVRNRAAWDIFEEEDRHVQLMLSGSEDAPK